LTHGRIEEIWFPRSTLRETGDTVLVTQWIVDKKERELQAAGIFEQIQGDPV
ncbi:MAG: hypothetical protein GWO19_09080, partial [Nitrospinaceae bacterium]|nr:hypothetical protein [Nitrospinaceae bacterium]NIU96361.1 hypothetical protein [Nitrospinaceae bacterium]